MDPAYHIGDTVIINGHAPSAGAYGEYVGMEVTIRKIEMDESSEMFMYFMEGTSDPDMYWLDDEFDIVEPEPPDEISVSVDISALFGEEGCS